MPCLPDGGNGPVQPIALRNTSNSTTIIMANTIAVTNSSSAAAHAAAKAIYGRPRAETQDTFSDGPVQ